MTNDIVFWSRDPDKMEAPTTDPMVISATIGLPLMRKILVDGGSSINIIFKKANDQMQMEAKDPKSCWAHIHSFNVLL